MQKVVRRSALAKAQAARKAAALKARKEHRLEALFFNARRERQSAWSLAERQERRSRRERAELATLAPQTARAQWDPRYGTIEVEGSQGFAKFSNKRLKQDGPCFFRKGDRVCVIRGHESIRGLIAKVQHVDEDRRVCMLDGLNFMDEWKRDAASLIVSSGARTISAPIEFSQLRLVYPLPDPHTGVPQDTIVQNLVRHNVHFDRFRNREDFDRYIEPQHIRVPWPEEADEEITPLDTPSDTLRLQTEEVSFLPTLLRPPMPLGVIDELRNKFSKFRVRHDEDYVRRKELEDEASAVETERTRQSLPRGARNIARRREQRGQGVEQRTVGFEISESLARKIGKHMAVASKLD